MKKLIKVFILLIALWTHAQSGGVITGLVKLENISEVKNRRILVTDGNGNIAFRTYNFIHGYGGSNYIPHSSGRVEYTHMPIFKNLPDKESNRYITQHTSAPHVLTYIKGTTSNVNYSAPAENEIGLKVLGDLVLPSNTVEPPVSFKYAVVIDNNGVLGKREINPTRHYEIKRYRLQALDAYNADCFVGLAGFTVDGNTLLSDTYNRYDYGFGIHNLDSFSSTFYIREKGGTIIYGIGLNEYAHVWRSWFGDVVMWASKSISDAPDIGTSGVPQAVLSSIRSGFAAYGPYKRCVYRKIYE